MTTAKPVSRAAILAEAGMGPQDVVRINAFVTDRAHMLAYMAARDAWLTGGGGRIDGCQCVRQRFGATQYTIARVHHLRAEKALPDLAEQPHAGASRKLLGLARIEVEKSQCAFIRTINHRHY